MSKKKLPPNPPNPPPIRIISEDVDAMELIKIIKDWGSMKIYFHWGSFLCMFSGFFVVRIINFFVLNNYDLFQAWFDIIAPVLFVCCSFFVGTMNKVIVPDSVDCRTCLSNLDDADCSYKYKKPKGWCDMHTAIMPCYDNCKITLIHGEPCCEGCEKGDAYS